MPKRRAVNRRAKAAKATVADSGNDLWPDLLEALREQFPEKEELTENEDDAFKSFLVTLEAGNASEKVLSLSLYTSCRLCGLFEEELRQSESALLDKCEKVVEELTSVAVEEPVVFSTPAGVAWNADYRNDNEVDQVLLRRIQTCHEKYQETPGDWHSPCFAVCQSSGWGKSRVLKELGKQIPLLYLSFLPDNSTGPPYGTQNTIYNLMIPHYLTANIPNLDIDMWLNTICHVDQLFSALKDEQKVMIDLDEQAFDWDKVKRKASLKKAKLKNDLIVIAFDEANHMLKEDQQLFRATTRMLQQLHRMTHGKIFGLMVDTDCRLFNFSPTETKYPPAKNIKDAPKLFPPFVLGGFNNCFELKGDSSWKRPQSILGFGRPLWGALFPDELNDSEKRWDSGRVANHAAVELCGGQVPDKWSSKYYLQSLSCMFARIGITLNPSVIVSWNLTAKHMATLLAVSNNRESILVTYISEPVLAMGAALLWRHESLLTDSMLPSLRHAFLQGVNLGGDLVQIVACILMLLIMDKMSEESYYHGEFFSLEVFLQHLGAEKSAIEDLTNKISGLAWIGFGHFIPWHRDVEETDLPVLLRRRAAVILKGNQDGADLLLPVWWESVEFGDKNVAYGFVLVQVRYYTQGTNLAEAACELSNDVVFEETNGMQSLPSVKVLLDVDLSAREKNDSTCHRLSLIEKYGEHVFECKKRVSKGIYDEKAEETGSMSKEQFSTDTDFFVLTIRGFDHLPVMNNEQAKEKKEKIKESTRGKMQDRDEGEPAKKKKLSESKVSKVLKSLLYGPFNPITWYKEECCSEGDVVPLDFLKDMLFKGSVAK